MLIVWILVGSGLLYLVQRLLYSEFWTRGLNLRLQFESSAVTEGDQVVFTERLENRKWLPLPMLGYTYVLDRNFSTITETDRKPLRFQRKLGLPARRAARNRTTLKSLPRGVYSFTAVTLSVTDLFYTVHREKTVPNAARMTVYPSKIPAEKLSLPFRQLLGAVLTRRMAQEDPFQLKGIRPYQIYDPLRTVNWKASARTGELKVNQYEYSTDEALVFLLDVGSGDEQQLENMLRLVSSLSQLFLRRGISVSLLSNGRSCLTGLSIRVAAGSGAGHQNVIDEALAQIKLTASVTAPFEAYLKQLPSSFLAGALPVVVSANPDGSSAEAFRSVLKNGNGYYISVNRQDETQSAGGITVLSWDPAGEEGQR